MLNIRNVEENDLNEIANLYVNIYKETNPREKWSLKAAEKFIRYFYNICPDMFFVAIIDDKIVAGIWGAIKPWWNGNKIYDLEIFVSKEYRGYGISKLVLEYYLEIALQKYQVVSVDAITFNDREFPKNYYERIALKKDEQLVLLTGDVKEIISKLQQ